MTPDVKHMKWWGWGEEGVFFNYLNKPGFAPFVKKALAVDLRPRKVDTIAFDPTTVPDSPLPMSLRDALVAATSADHVTVDPHERVVHGHGSSVTELLHVSRGDYGRLPEVVVYPASDAEVAGVLTAAVEQDAVVVPYGGGTNIARSLQLDPAETRPIISLDTGLLDGLRELDEDSGLARVGGGMQGPALEEALNDRGWTLGHMPDSFTHSTVGGWAATRSSGMQSDKYGDIADIVRGMTVVRPSGTVTLRPVPSESTGPSLREMFIGSEGRLGVITELWLQVHRLPAERVANQNPIMTELAAQLDRGNGLEEPIALSSGGCRPGGAALVITDTVRLKLSPRPLDGAAETYVVPTFEGGSRTFTENLRYQWLATAGSFSRGETGGPRDAAGNPATISTEWRPPTLETGETERAIDLWVIQRDERGGTSWLDTCVRVVPPGRT